MEAVSFQFRTERFSAERAFYSVDTWAYQQSGEGDRNATKSADLYHFGRWEGKEAGELES